MSFGRQHPTPRVRGRRRGNRLLLGSLSLALVVPLGLAPSALAAEGPKGLGRSDVPDPRSSKVAPVTGQGAKKARDRRAKDAEANARQTAEAKTERQARWPGAGKATLKLAAAPKWAAPAAGPLAPARAAAGNAGDVPVAVTPAPAGSALSPRASGRSAPQAPAAGDAHVTVLDQKAAERAGITGVLLTATADTAGRAELSVDYSGFAGAVGGGWAQRLRLVRLPGCALTTPEKDECRTQTPLPSRNDVKGQSVSAEVTLGAGDDGLSTQLLSAATGSTAVFAVAATGGDGASPAGTGDYSATELSESSSWQAGASSGAFTWSYDFTTPAPAAGPAPELKLSYDSGSVDGRTAGTNNQGTTVGEGFSITESYIERSYGRCDDDGHADVFDSCWKYDNATLMLNGKASRLVKNGSTWRLQGDDASKVTRSTGADNGDDDGEYWTVVTGDGSKYVFGLNKLSGAGTERTGSTWTVPVFGDDSGEPGYDKGSSFADRSVTQAWRWNLDYVEDTHGNAATYWYAKETNYYKKNKATKASADYTRGGYLKEIDYGLRKDALFTGKPDAKITFGYAERCTATDCSSLTKDTAKNWPDVPFTAICSQDDTDCYATAPSFFTRKRLTAVNTYVWDAASTTHQPVDSWALTQEYLDGGDIGDSSDQVLTLKSLRRTGKAGTDIALNPLSFTYQMRPNRVDATDDILPLTRPRISTITTETGGITTVTLSGPECVRSEVLGAAEDTNTRNCYPQYWNINGAAEASVDWFHKYRVTAVNLTDPAGQNDGVEHEYVYGGAAWRYNDEPLAPKDERTWSDWRGYREVTVYNGARDTTRSKTVTLFMQGMDGDKKKDGTTKSVSLAPLSTPDLGIAPVTDSEQYAGTARETVTYDGATPISASVNDPWSQETARQTVPDAADLVARFVGTRKSTAYTYLTVPKTWRSTATATTYDAYGMESTKTEYGDTAKSGDETCTRTWYARNDAAGITKLVSRTRKVGKACSVADSSLVLPATTDTRGDVISDTATVYDKTGVTGWTASQTPTLGEATWQGRTSGYAATADTSGNRNPTGWQTTEKTTYDSLGRSLTTEDALGQTSSTAYTPTDDGPVTRTVTTDAAGHREVALLEPLRGQPVTKYDKNLKKTEITYDALGRITQVWLPNRSRAVGYSPNKKFSYAISNTKPSAVGTSVLKADGETYSTQYTIYDALLRKLQTQSDTPQGGRLLTDTRYDSRGLAYETHVDIFDSTTAPNGTYTRAEYGESPKQSNVVFDGAERTVSNTLYTFGVKKWSKATSYTGDSTAVTDVTGGVGTRNITDALGRTVESREYAGPGTSDSGYGGSLGAGYSSVRTSYAPDGKKTSVTGPDGAKWSYGYDLFGREKTVSDPDKGTSSNDYDALDRVEKTTDSRGKSIITEYDKLGRVTGTWAGSKTDANQLTARTYDFLLKGKPYTTTRYVGGKTGKAYTSTVTAYDDNMSATATKVELPADDPLVKAGVPSVIEFDTQYRLDGTIKNSTEPGLGGLAKEIVDYDYTDTGQVTKITGATGYLLDADYAPTGEAQQYVLGTANTETTKKIYLTNTYEEGTGRLTRSHVTDQTHPYMLQDLNFAYDPAGNVTSATDPALIGGQGQAETQCFSYDGHRRLTEAWTPASQKCADPRDASSLSGPAPYWNGYTYNTAGQRTSEARHTANGTATDTYCYTSGAQPHTLAGISTNGDCAAPQRTYTYDSSGNTRSRPGDQGQQDLIWSAEGKLSRLTEGTQGTDYVYDPDGALMIKQAANGERILYAGNTELHLRANGTTWAQRSYRSGNLTVAVRTNQTGTNKLYYLAADHHGTQSLAITSDAAQTFSKRYTTPFGDKRGGAVGSWPTDKRFLGKTADDDTGLTHVNAREYDPGIGQFLSVDPDFNASRQQSLNGYAYAGNNPATLSDGTGLAVPECMQPSKYGITCRGGIPVSSGSGSGSGGSGGGGGGGSGGGGGGGGTAGTGNTTPSYVSGATIYQGSTGYTSGYLMEMYTIRQDYKAADAAIRENGLRLVNAGGDASAIAQEAVIARNLNRFNARGPIEQLAFPVVRRFTGTVDFPTYEQLREGSQRATATPKTDMGIIDSAAKTNPTADRLARGARIAGRGLIGLEVGVGVYNVATAPEGEKVQTAARETGGIVGGLAGAQVGAMYGASIGTLCGGPVGTAVGGIVGGVVGGVIGSGVGRKIGDFLGGLF
ncbi:RHS repeat-associated core domain-containing protein [Streptomyces sp. NPDC051909]|uniref:RHS repeat domain-containing protein n=1 Tax=Streptomyces sp. NPDC051909 TaxID=3154944 RepID=UPI00344AAE3E